MRSRGRRFILAAIVILLTLSAIYAFTPPPSVDLVMDGWVTRTIGPGITCQVPETLQPKKVQPFDSVVTVFENADMSVSFDFGWYSNSLKSWRGEPGYSQRTVRIGSRAAKLVRVQPKDSPGKPYVAAVAFRNVSGSGNTSNHLTGSCAAATPAGQEMGEKILRTIRFDAKVGE